MNTMAQDNTILLKEEMFNEYNQIPLADLDGWIYQKGSNPLWADESYPVDDWQELKPTQLKADLDFPTSKVEGWFRLKFKLDSSMQNIPLAFDRQLVH